MRYSVFMSDQKSCCCFCACHNSKTNFIPQSQEQKSCGRQTQHSSIVCGCLCTQPVWCCPMEPFQMRYFVVHYLQMIKNHVVVFVPSTTVDCNLFNNHRIKKVVGGNCNILVNYKNASAPNPEDIVLCSTFK